MGQVSRGLGARAPRAWGPAHQGPGAFSPQKPPKPLKLRFFANLLVGAWRRRGCRLKRLLRRWGPGGKRSRDTPPTPPPPRKEEGFHPLRLREPSNTPPKVGGYTYFAKGFRGQPRPSSLNPKPQALKPLTLNPQIPKPETRTLKP